VGYLVSCSAVDFQPNTVSLLFYVEKGVTWGIVCVDETN